MAISQGAVERLSGLGQCQYNAAPEWQARRLMWRSRALVVACPLEGRVIHATRELALGYLDIDAQPKPTHSHRSEVLCDSLGKAQQHW